MRKATHIIGDLRTNCRVTRHAWRRMCERGMSADVVLGVIQYGRKAYVRGAVIHAVGRREVRRFSWRGVDLVDMEGVQVVCSTDGALMTVYRNHDFRGLRPRSVISPPPSGRPPTFDVLRHLPPRHATPLSRVVPAVRPSDFGLMVPAALDAGGLSGVPRGRQLPERLGEQFLDDAPLRRRMGGVVFFC